MKKTLLIYGSIWGYSAEKFVTEISAMDETDELTVRLNSGGGSPEYAWSMISALQDFKGKKILKIEGQAMSMAAFFTAYFDEVEALDVTEMMIHRASYGEWFEKSDYFTAELKGNLERVNASLRKAVENKIDVEKFEKLKKTSMDEIFSMDSRIDVFLTSKEAKSIGLISSVTKITPDRRAEINAEMIRLSAEYFPNIQEIKKPEPKADHSKNSLNTNKKMTLEELKASEPELVAQVLAMGVTQERERVKAFAEFLDVDAEGSKKAILDGTEMTPSIAVEFGKKAGQAEQIAKIEADAKEAADKTKGAGQDGKDLKGAEVELSAEDQTVKRILENRKNS